MKNFNLACDTSGVHEGAAMCMLYFFMHKTASAVLAKRPSVERTDEKNSQMASGSIMYFTTYPQYINFFLKKYATNQDITKTESETMRIEPLSRMTPSQYAE